MGAPDVSRHLEEGEGCGRWYRAGGRAAKSSLNRRLTTGFTQRLIGEQVENGWDQTRFP